MKQTPGAARFTFPVSRFTPSAWPEFSFGRHDLRMVWIVAAREMRDFLRDWRIVLPMLLLTLGSPVLMNYTAQRLLGFVEQFGTQLIGDRLVPFLLLVVGFFPLSFSLVIALEAFVGEKERNSLEPLLATPLTNLQLYLGKMLAALLPPLLASYVATALYLLGLLRGVGWTVPLELLAQVILLTTVQAVVMVSGAVIVSSQTTSVRAANLLASFIIIPMALLIQFEAAAMFWGNIGGLWWLAVGLAITAVVLVRMGVHLFNREELLGRDIDQIRLGRMARLFWRRFSGRAVTGGRYPTARQWYAQLFHFIPALRLPVGVIVVALLGAVALGAFLAVTFQLPRPIQEALLNSEATANLADLQDVLAGLPFTIFLHNVRAILILAVLGMFTFGVLALFIFMLPWVIIAYVTGQFALAGANPLTFILASVAPHALVELPALLLAAAAALRWHTMIISPPPNRSVTESWLMAAADFGRVLVGLVAPLLLVAAFLEAYLTPMVLVKVYGG